MYKITYDTLKSGAVFHSSEFLIYWLFVQYDLQSIERVGIFTFCTELNEEIVIT